MSRGNSGFKLPNFEILFYSVLMIGKKISSNNQNQGSKAWFVNQAIQKRRSYCGY